MRPFRGTRERPEDVVRDVSGEVRLDVKAIGTTRDPHVDGLVEMTNAAFLVTATGSKYKNARAALTLARDRMTVDSLHVEDGDGHVSIAELFRGTLSDADVSIDIDRSTLRASYNGRLDDIDPAVPFADAKLDASLTGSGSVTATVRDLLSRPTTLPDYDVHGTLALRSSRVRDVRLDTAQVDATLRDSKVVVARLDVSGPAIEGRGSGTAAFADGDASDFQYDLTRADLRQLRSVIGQDVGGTISTKGRVTGRRPPCTRPATPP